MLRGSAALLLLHPRLLRAPCYSLSTSAAAAVAAAPPLRPARPLPRAIPHPVAKTTDFEFHKETDKGKLTSGSSQKSIAMVKPEKRGSLHQFVKENAQNIVLASWPKNQLSEEGGGSFLINMDAFDFLSIKVRVSMRATVTYDAASSTARFESSDFIIQGMRSVHKPPTFAHGKLIQYAPFPLRMYIYIYI